MIRTTNKTRLSLMGLERRDACSAVSSLPAHSETAPVLVSPANYAEVSPNVVSMNCYQTINDAISLIPVNDS